MKLRACHLIAILISTATQSQELIQVNDGAFYCHGDHPRCSYPDQSTYPYYQFDGQHIGQMSGISDLLPDGPPLLQYQTFLTELISDRPDTNAVATWSDVTSRANGGRVWGSFISARSGFTEPGADSQLIGLEVDVLNGGLPGTYPNASKVGVQIVGFGNANTNAIEIATQTPSAAFQNIISIQANSISPDGTVIGMVPQHAMRGIDFQGSTFSDGAIIVSPNQKFVFRAPGLSDAAIWRDDVNGGSLVLQSGPAGLRIANSINTANLLTVTPDGDLVTPEGSFSNIIGRLTNLEQSGGIASSSGYPPVTLELATSNTSGLPDASATGADSTAGGAGATASGDRSLALGNGSAASADQSTAIGSNAQSSGNNSVALGANSSDDGIDNVVSVGTTTQTRRVTNVSAGVNPTDAVNMSQLASSMNQSINDANTYTDQRFAEINYDLNKVRRDANGATASAMALASIPQSFERGRGMIGMGISTWQGQSAIAIGVSKATDDGRLAFRAGATYNSRDQGGANAGVGLSF